MVIEREILEQVGEFLRGSCKSVGDAMEALELGDTIDESDLEGQLLEVETELCVQCHWWHEVCELQYSEKDGGGLCQQCCDDLGVEFD